MDKLLIANRGEIASRIIRSAHELGIDTVAVFSDADATAPFVREADEAVRLPGTTSADTYLRADLLLEAARRTGADAVHPGYGFLSEQAAFARECDRAGFVFVGPPAQVIESMGSKITAKRVMAAAGVPVLEHVLVDAGMSARDLHAAVHTLGYPLLVKASAGGGGRGMRAVTSPDDLVDAVDAAQREARAAFGDGTVFLERLVESPRHVEIQILADVHGHVTHLFERECSIQRRHQKVIEESPSPAMSTGLRRAMTDAAITAARTVGYVNAGTVEFVVAPDETFAFLEMNTRLQVEHPVTEAVTGLDLVALQLRLAQGEHLPEEVRAARLSGHAIEARLYAEDVGAGYLPVIGRLDRFHIPLDKGIRVDSGYAEGSTVSPFYDAMLAKVVAWGPTRALAAHRLAEALARSEIHGIATNRDLLVRVVRHPSFLAGSTDTGFLERHGPELTAGRAPDAALRRVHAVACAVLSGARGRRASPLPSGLPAGWRNVGPACQPVELEDVDGTVSVSLATSRSGLQATVGGQPLHVVVHAISGDTVDLEVDGHRVRCRVQQVEGGDSEATTVYVDSILGSSEVLERPRFPTPCRETSEGSLRAPMPGTVVRVEVEPGTTVDVGAPLVTLEAMKMEHILRSPHAGTVDEIRVAVGAQVDAGAVLVVVRDEGHSALSNEPADRPVPLGNITT